MTRAALPLALLFSAASAGLVALAGCGGAYQAPGLADERWPDSPPSYRAAHAHWTRHDYHIRGSDTVVDAYATLKTTDWRAAFVDEKIARGELPATAKAELAAEQQRAAAETWEIELLVATHDYTANDLDRGKSSIWRLYLRADDGAPIAPLSVKTDRRIKPEVAAWFPDYTPFHRAYVVRFPKVPGAKLELVMGSSLGNVAFTWGR